MALHDIVLMGDPVLRERAAEVTEFDQELEQLVQDMFETMYGADGIGLAAPQIGLSKRVIVVDLRRDEEAEAEPKRVALVNPVISWASTKTAKASEGCLSIPGLEELVSRPAAVRVDGKDPSGRDVVVEADELFARALQHEIDHLDGVLFIDRVSPLKRRMLLSKWKKRDPDE